LRHTPHISGGEAEKDTFFCPTLAPPPPAALSHLKAARAPVPNAMITRTANAPNAMSAMHHQTLVR
jgi:hypothetical protein